MKINRYIRLAKIFSIRNGYKRAEYLRRKKYFKKQGEHCYFQPYNFGTEPELISFGDNVHIASGVTFVNHDITALMFRYQDNNPKIDERKGEIKIGNNVFIGSNTLLLYGTEIGDDVIIGAGSLVNKKIPNGTVAAGIPCKVIGRYEDYKKKIITKSYRK